MVEVDRSELIKKGELAMIESGWNALKENDLAQVQKTIMTVLESYNTGSPRATDLWAIKYYAQIASPESPTELEKLVKAYLEKTNEKVSRQSDEKVSYFSKYELGIIDEIFDDWKNLTNHKGESANKLFLGWLKDNFNFLKDRMDGES